MALVSPGIQVTVTDQSNYVPSSNGTVPYILLATSENKTAPGGGLASGTLAVNAGKLYAITSQRDLVNTFGAPKFQQTASGAAVNGSEYNEYGLLAAYSALGVSNQVFVQRADIDLAELNGSTSRPSGIPDNGTYWLDSDSSQYGLYVWDASKQQFNNVSPLIDSKQKLFDVTPDPTVGAIGDYLIYTATVPMVTWYKNYANQWVVVGTDSWKLSIPAVTGALVTNVVGGSFTVNGATVTVSEAQTAEQIANAINSAVGASNVSGVFAHHVGDAVTIAVNTVANDDASVTIAGQTSVLAGVGLTAGKYYGAVVSFGQYYAQPAWGEFDDMPRPTNSVWVKVSRTGQGADFALNRYSTSTGQWSTVTVDNHESNADATYANDPTNGGFNIAIGTVWSKYDVRTVSWQLWYRKLTGVTVVTGFRPASEMLEGGSFSLQVTQPSKPGYDQTYSRTVSFPAGSTIDDFIVAIGTSIPNLRAAKDAEGRLVLTHKTGGDIRLYDVTGDALESMGLIYAQTPNGTVQSATNFYSSNSSGTGPFLGTNWAPLTYLVENTAPYISPDDGTLWYWNVPTHVDIMINDGTHWRGYRSEQLVRDVRGYELTNTDRNGVQIQTVAPSKQSDGVTDLVEGDLWIDSSNLEEFPVLYRYQKVNNALTWVLIDKTDKVSQNGIIFADARWSNVPSADPALDAIATTAELAVSDWVDPDAPDASLYPRGTLLFNTRASSYGVKKYVVNYFTEAAYPSPAVLPTFADTWVTVSGTRFGSNLPAFGRHAQRTVVINAMKAAIDSSTAIREEQNRFNLIACPGYPELIPNMVSLNNDRNNTGFIIGDTPMRLPATGTDIISWAQNSGSQTQTNESGLTNHDPYLAVYYPSGQTNDLSGNAVVVPPSHAMIRAFIRSDNASYPWFAPAGTRRGQLDNVNAVGYIDPASGSFVSIGVTQGLRDTMYANQINPLTYLQGAGLVAYGNKTTAATPSALDRINVSRLINYIRSQLDYLGRPYIFEPNDPITRNQIKTVTESLLNDIVSKRGITDYLVVCDSSNNTPDRIARNELYVDVAIQPTKDVEFIYIPIRLKNPGELESGNVASTLTAGTGA